MAKQAGTCQHWTLFLLTVFFVSQVHSTSVLAGDVAIVVNPNVPPDDLSFSELRTILLRDRQFWSSGLRVTLLIPPPSRFTAARMRRTQVASGREIIFRTVYQMNEAQFRKYWIAKVFRAEASAGPEIVYSNEMATELLTAIPGPISFLDAADIPDEVKVLRINGHLPGQKDYPLR